MRKSLNLEAKLKGRVLWSSILESRWVTKVSVKWTVVIGHGLMAPVWLGSFWDGAWWLRIQAPIFPSNKAPLFLSKFK